MEKPIVLRPPLTDEAVARLHVGDRVAITGTIYGARDAAHKRLVALIKNGDTVPFPIQGSILYYVGPCPGRPGRPTLSAGPTTASRMDRYAPVLIKHVLKGMIGKGIRSEPVIEAMRRYRAVYFGAIGGAGALLASGIRRCEPIAFEELGPEAIYLIEVEDFPVFVFNDAGGDDLYRMAIKRYKQG
jgi:fumarate hydratase subunit beta